MFLSFPQIIGAGNPGRGGKKTSLVNNICSKDARYSFTKELEAQKVEGVRSRVQGAVVECRRPSETPARQLHVQRLNLTTPSLIVHEIPVRTNYI